MLKDLANTVLGEKTQKKEEKVKQPLHKVFL